MAVPTRRNAVAVHVESDREIVVSATLPPELLVEQEPANCVDGESELRRNNIDFDSLRCEGAGERRDTREGPAALDDVQRCRGEEADSHPACYYRLA